MHQALQAHELTQHLPPPVARHEGVDLVDHDVTKIAEEAGEVLLSVDEEAFQTLGRGLQHTPVRLERPPLHALPHIPVPRPYVHPGMLKEGIETVELIVDQGLERPEVQHTDAA